MKTLKNIGFYFLSFIVLLLGTFGTIVLGGIGIYYTFKLGITDKVSLFVGDVWASIVMAIIVSIPVIPWMFVCRSLYQKLDKTIEKM